MEKQGWKVLAIVFAILLIVETLFMLWAYRLALQEERDYNVCAFDYCEEYEYAELIDGICYCYEYDILGQLQVAKYKPINMIE